MTEGSVPDERLRPGLLAWVGLALLAGRHRNETPVERVVVREPVRTDRRSYERDRSRAPRASWGAILAGAGLASGLLVLFGVFGTGLMLATRDEGWPWLLGSRSLTAVGALLAQVIALGLGGYVAARFAPVSRRLDGALHGLVVWAVLSILAALAMTGGVLWAGERASLITTAAIRGGAEIAASATDALGRAAASGVESAAIELPLEPEGVASEAIDIARQATRSPEETLDDLGQALAAAVNVVRQPEAEAPRGALPSATGAVPDDNTLAKLIAQQTGVSEARAREGIPEWRAQAAPQRTLPEVLRIRAEAFAEGVRSEIGRALEPALDAIAMGLLAGAALMLAGALAALTGGAVGAGKSSDNASNGLEYLSEVFPRIA